MSEPEPKGPSMPPGTFREVEGFGKPESKPDGTRRSRPRPDPSAVPRSIRCRMPERRSPMAASASGASDPPSPLANRSGRWRRIPPSKPAAQAGAPGALHSRSEALPQGRENRPPRR